MSLGESKIIENSRKLTITYLVLIGIAGLSLRMAYFPYDVPLALDAVSYFWYAIDTSILGHFPDSYNFPNTGWPAFLSLFFTIWHSDNFMDYMTMQRFLSVLVSVLTIIPIYFVCKRFFNRQLAFLGAAFFAFEPHVIQNSLIGITDPLYIFLITLSFSFMHNNNGKIVYLAFAIGALASLTRYEGLLFFGVLSVLFFSKYRKDRKIFVRYALACSIFVLVLLPFLYLRIQSTGDDGLTSHVVSGVVVTNNIATNEENGMLNFLSSGFDGIIKYFGWTMIPYFVILAPYGFFVILKNRNSQNLSVLLSMIVLSLPAFYAYARQIQEPRYLLVLIPFFSILSLFLVEMGQRKTNNYKIITIVVLIGIILLPSLSRIKET